MESPKQDGNKDSLDVGALKKQGVIPSGEEIQAENEQVMQYVLNIDAETWIKVASWSKEYNILSAYDRDFLVKLGGLRFGKQEPTIQEAHYAYKIVRPILDVCLESYYLQDFLEGKRLEIVDMRSQGGALWVMGGAELHPVLEGAQIHGHQFIYAKDGGKASNYRPAWFWGRRMG